MPCLRLAICALPAFLVGCVSSSPYASVPFEASKYDFPAGTVVRTEAAYTAPAYAPAVVSTPQAAYVYAPAVKAYDPTAVTTPVYGRVAEDGSYYGQPNVKESPRRLPSAAIIARTAPMSAAITEAPRVLTSLRPAVVNNYASQVA